MEEQQILDIFVPVLYALLPIITIIILFKIRTTYKIEQLKTQKKVEKNEETIAGGIGKMIDDSPNNLKQIDSEIAELHMKCVKNNITPEIEKDMLSRLNSERDFLSLGAKYGKMVKPFLKPLDKIVTKVLGGWSN